jgi:hypothetical protein
MKNLGTIFAVILLGSMSSAGAMTATEAAKIFSQFEELKPPFDAASARRVFGDAKWIDSVEVRHVTIIAGSMLISMDRGGEIFVINLVRGSSMKDCWWVEVRTTNAIRSEATLRDFLRGKAPPDARIVEYVCVTYGILKRVGEENRVPE